MRVLERSAQAAALRLSVGPPVDAPAPLSLSLFGPFEARVNGQPFPALRSRKGQWLLALLALRHGREVERSWLAAMLWPDSDEPQSFSSLRRSLTDLRQALGPEAYRLQSPNMKTIRLDLEGADVDVAEFDRALKRDDMETAVSVYRGRLLEGCLEEWVLEERDSREQSYLCALESLAERALNSGDPVEAARLLKLAIAVDPLRESAHRSLMQALAEGGNCSAAIVAYRDLRQYLRSELNSDPTPETTAIFQQLRADARRRAEPEIPIPPERERETTLRPRRLPQPLTPLVGRENELAEIRKWLVSSRLVTLVGPGGVGKTRLAIQVASEFGEGLPDGACFVDLSSVTDPNLLAEAIASALQIHEDVDRPLKDTMIDRIWDKSLLLVLDNCEQLVDACAGLAEELLTACQHLRILATARQPLRVGGEVTWRVPSLSLPDSHEEVKSEDLSAFEATRLFTERATAASTSFRATDSNAKTIVHVCRQLDGIPLAIELAAARLRALTVEQISARLADRFGLLTHGGRTALPRQQTLQAAIDWSYDLLSEKERIALRRLSVFPMEFPLDAATAVCGGDGIAESEALDLVSGLAEKSMLSVQEHEREARYRMLESTREYARKLLTEAGDLTDTMHRYAAFVLEIAEECKARYNSVDLSRCLDRLEDFQDSTRVVLDWLTREDATQEDLEVCCRLTVCAYSLWSVRGYWAEARSRLARILSRVTEPTPLRAQVLFSAGNRAFVDCDYERAREYLFEASEINGAQGDLAAHGSALSLLGMVEDEDGNDKASMELHEQSLVIWREVGYTRGECIALNNLGLLAQSQGDFKGAVRFHRECLELNRCECSPMGMAWALDNLGDTFLALGELEAAEEYYRESLAIFHELEARHGIFECLLGLGQLAAARGGAHTERAALLFGAAESLRESLGHPLRPAEREGYGRALTATRESLSEPVFSSLWQEGLKMDTERAVAYAREQ